MANQDQLIGAKLGVEEIRQHLGATSLGYLSLKGVMRAIGMGKENFCTACFSGHYPIDVPNDLKLTKMILEPVA
jgi:amidophosphoribosyltransferase